MARKALPAPQADLPIGEPAEQDATGHPDGHEPAVLLATKLHVPHISDRLVTRSALVNALEQGVSGKLTLLIAPAGWGKTTLLAQWVAGHAARDRVAWLGLDRADNDPARFWSYVIAALRHSEPALSARALDLLEMGADMCKVVLATLLNEVDLLDDAIVLILDDYHLVTNRAVHDQMAFMIERMPTNLRLVLASRSDPALPLARLRAGADLRELRTDELRLAADEATMLLNGVLALGLADSDIRLLHERIEGWAAGLYLAALSLAGRRDKHAFVTEFAGDNRHIVDYLSAEVLDGQQPDLRTFLVRTSVLTRLSGPLCDAVLDTAGSASMLQKIERDNLFLVPLDWSRRWYRYHQLFAELLRSELHRAEPNIVPVLHRRAADWFRAAGLVDDAVHHLTSAGDIAAATDLIAARWAAEINVGRLATVSGWLDLLPRSAVSADPRLGIARAWIALDTGHIEHADAWIDATEDALAASSSDAGTLPAELVVLRAVSRFKIGDIDASLSLAHQAVDLDLGDARVGLAAYCMYGSALYWSGRTAEAQEAYRHAARLADEVENHLGRAYALGYLAVISAQHGLLDDAECLVQQVTGDGRDFSAGEHFVDMMTSLAMAKILDRRGDTASAAEAARMSVVLAQRGGSVIEVAHALMTQSEILGHLGNVKAARASVAEAGRVLGTAIDPPRARRLLAAAALPTADRPLDEVSEPGMGEELTNKELDVLRLMATPLSRSEIGAHMFVSLNTVKTHQRALYRKLGVVNRAAAVDYARARGML